MKTINNIRQIKDEKRRLRQRREDLEYRIRGVWGELKEDLRPAHLAGEALERLNRPAAPETSNLLKETLYYGLGLLARKLADKTGDRITHLLKKRK